MFSNFQKAFLKKSEINELIPKEIVKSLGEKLPEGFEYKCIGHDTCGIAPTSLQLNIGMSIEIPDDLFKEFKPSTMHELMEFIYRTQRQLKVVPDEEGCILLNGIKFKIEDMIKFPLEDKIMVGTELYIRPEPFQPPFKVRIEGEGITKHISFQRQPYADMHKSYFKNVDDSVLQISYILDEKNNTIKFIFNIDIEKSKNAKEIIEGLKLYQSCLKGEVKIAGINLAKFIDEDKAIEKTIEFWNRICQLERKLDVEFLLDFPIKIDDITWIEKLYRSFVEEKPYKQYVNVDKITIRKIDKYNKEELTTSSDLMFYFVQNSELEIWGVKINMYDGVGLFGFKVSDIVLTNKEMAEYELLLKSTTDSGIYQSIRHFAKKEEAEKYKSCIKDLENGKLISID
ncbi:abortive infection system toxin AbiGii family protein [Clostridium polyendosporum]|nr:abortive infection system toxin AbiGii family protein [Clostridium polyendosporum]